MIQLTPDVGPKFWALAHHWDNAGPMYCAGERENNAGMIDQRWIIAGPMFETQDKQLFNMRDCQLIM